MEIESHTDTNDVVRWTERKREYSSTDAKKVRTNMIAFRIKTASFQQECANILTSDATKLRFQKPVTSP